MIYAQITRRTYPRSSNHRKHSESYPCSCFHQQTNQKTTSFFIFAPMDSPIFISISNMPRPSSATPFHSYSLFLLVYSFVAISALCSRIFQLKYISFFRMFSKSCRRTTDIIPKKSEKWIWIPLFLLFMIIIQLKYELI